MVTRLWNIRKDVLRQIHLRLGFWRKLFIETWTLILANVPCNIAMCIACNKKSGVWSFLRAHRQIVKTMFHQCLSKNVCLLSGVMIIQWVERNEIRPNRKAEVSVQVRDPRHAFRLAWGRHQAKLDYTANQQIHKHMH